MSRWNGLVVSAALFVLEACGGGGGSVTPPVIEGDGFVGGGCTLDVQCFGANPRCDKNSGKCVPCLPLNDNCVQGTHCVEQSGSFVCSATCRNAADCPKSDAGAPGECCGGTCLDTSADTANCGGCGKACPMVANGSAACVAGACVAKCGAGFADCNMMIADGCEVDLSSALLHCGGCGKACGAVVNGTPTCDKGVCGYTCNPGFRHCSQVGADGCEVNVNTDLKNCGGCGMPCAAAPHAQNSCMAGACGIAMCDPGFADCNKTYADGCESDGQSDVANCGACGNACPAQNATPSCSAGKCAIASCNAGFANCDGLGGNGCEVQVQSDVKNCGACARVCIVPNGVPGCAMGACTIAACNPGFADCNGNVVDGCETRIGSDVGNCGGCGKACPMVANGAPACVNATCAVASCKFGFADCDMMFANGCEANLLTPQTCGACNVQCAAPAHASAGCGGGMCGIGMCDPLFGDCDGNAQNGCERSLATDAQNCGGCNVICALPNATQSCASGACVVGACLPGFADCDVKPANGCEVQSAVDVNNCGACGKACPMGANATPTCANSSCGLACSANFADCDKMAGNGCEVALLTDVNNCNACGAACANVANGTRGCAAGKCTIGSCNMGFADCDMNVGTGCERNLNTDPASCGACGKVCALANAVAGCTNGGCTLSACNAGFSDCDKIPGNGCEVTTNTDNKNCGACGVVCGGMSPFCVAGVCGQCNPNVLVIGDGSVAPNNQYVTALQNAGLTPTLVQNLNTYNGVPAATNFSAVVVLVGNLYGNDMPAAGQTSIATAHSGGAGVVFVEWAGYQVQNAFWGTLKSLVLMTRASGNSARPTFVLTQANHPLWSGLPNSFQTVNTIGISTGMVIVNNGSQLASCVDCGGPGVAIRDNGVGGRLVHIDMAPDFNLAPAAGDLMWGNDTNSARLMVNALKWAARCL